MNAIRDTITKGHLGSDGDCFFKAKLSKYEECVPKVNVEGLKKLLEKDVEVCLGVQDRVEDSLAIV